MVYRQMLLYLFTTIKSVKRERLLIRTSSFISISANFLWQKYSRFNYGTLKLSYLYFVSPKKSTLLLYLIIIRLPGMKVLKFSKFDLNVKQTCLCPSPFIVFDKIKHQIPVAISLAKIHPIVLWEFSLKFQTRLVQICFKDCTERLVFAQKFKKVIVIFVIKFFF
jgi:hypothetical protein